MHIKKSHVTLRYETGSPVTPVLHISLIRILDGNITTAIFEINQLNLYVGVCVKKI